MKIVNYFIGCAIAVSLLSNYPAPQVEKSTGIDIVKRAYEQTGIKYTALARIPENAKNGRIQTWFPEGSELSGVIYSNAWNVHKYVGFDVSLNTYISAVNNRYSLFYTEVINRWYHQSGYGKRSRYFGTNSGCYFGAVCSTFVSYCLGLTKAWDTNIYSMFAKRGIFTALSGKTSENLNVGDVIWHSGHGRVVTDIKTDAASVTDVEISEADGTITSTKWYSADEIDSYINKYGCIIYRYNNINDQEKYNIETISPINKDICTFAGNYACFAEGEDIFINYENNTSFTKAKLYKDEDMIAEIPLDRLDTELFHNIVLYDEEKGEYKPSGVYAINLSDVGNAHRSIVSDEYLVDMSSIEECIFNEDVTKSVFYNLGRKSLAHGKYKMCLSNDTSNSDFTYFEIIEATVELEKIDNLTGSGYTISFSSANGRPVYTDLINHVGGGSCTYIFSNNDISEGKATFYPDELGMEQIHKNPLKNKGNNSIRVYFQGDYGRAVREIIPVIIKDKDGKYNIDSTHNVII